MRVEGIFSQNLMNDLIRTKFEEIVKLQDIIKKYDLNYKSKSGKTCNYGNYSRGNFAHELKKLIISAREKVLNGF